MKPFHELTHRGQVGRLKRLAMMALGEYELKPRRISLLVHLFNTTFRVDTESGRYVMRVVRPDHRDHDELRSEAQWLAAISRETKLIVPEPVLNRARALVTRVKTDGVPEPRDCLLFRWVDGRFRRQGLGPKALQGVGGFMARLHEQVLEFEPPAGFKRKHLELDGEVGVVMDHGLATGGDVIGQDGADTLRETAARIRPVIEDLGIDPLAYNLIHADLHQANYLFHRGEVRAIDFDDCGWGHFAYDVAVSFWYIRGRPDFPALRSAFLEGYRAVREFSEADEASLDAFTALRSLLMVSYVAGETNPKIRAWAPRFVAAILPELEGFSKRD